MKQNKVNQILKQFRMEETKKSQNPSAFPIMATEQSFFNQEPMSPQSGMTLRDYYANSAMQGLVANARTVLNSKELANSAYLIADAMLKQREL